MCPLIEKMPFQIIEVDDAGRQSPENAPDAVVEGIQVAGANAVTTFVEIMMKLKSGPPFCEGSIVDNLYF